MLKIMALQSRSCQSISTREKRDSGWRMSSSREPRPTQSITTFQAPCIDRLHGDHDSQIAVTLGTGALEHETSHSRLRISRWRAR
jgi:hypothetical protein